MLVARLCRLARSPPAARSHLAAANVVRADRAVCPDRAGRLPRHPSFRDMPHPLLTRATVQPGPIRVNEGFPGTGREGASRRPLALRGVEGVDAPGQASLPVGGLILVDDRLGPRPCRGASPPCADPRPNSRPRRSRSKTARLTRVLISDLAALLRRRATSLVRLRLIWLLMLATTLNSLGWLGRARLTRPARKPLKASRHPVGRRSSSPDEAIRPGRRPPWPRPAHRT